MLFVLFCYIHVNLMCTLLACIGCGDEHHLFVSKDGGEGFSTRKVDGKVMKVCLKRKLVGGGERINHQFAYEMLILF